MVKISATTTTISGSASRAYSSIGVSSSPHTVYIATPTGGVMLLRDDATGTAQLVIDDETNTVLGATFVGPDLAELLHSATIAITAKVPIDVLWHAVPSYPTASELWLRLLDSDREATR